MTPDYSAWVTKQAAAVAIGVSTKTVETLAKDGDLEAALYKRPGGGARIRVYNPDDVARLAMARRQEAGGFVLPDNAAVPPVQQQLTPAAAPPDALLHNLHTLVAAILQVVTSENLLGTRRETLYVDLGEAAAVVGLSVRRLRKFIRAGKLKAVRDAGDWRVRRRDLEVL